MSCPSLEIVSSCKLIISDPLMASHKYALHHWPHYLCWFLSFSVTICPLHFCPLYPTNPGSPFTLHYCCLAESAVSSISLPRQHRRHPCFFFDLQCHDFFLQLIFKPYRNSWEILCAAKKKSSIKSYLSLSCILIFLPVSKRDKTAICNYIFFSSSRK